MKVLCIYKYRKNSLYQSGWSKGESSVILEDVSSSEEIIPRFAAYIEKLQAMEPRPHERFSYWKLELYLPENGSATFGPGRGDRAGLN